MQGGPGRFWGHNTYLSFFAGGLAGGGAGLRGFRGRPRLASSDSARSFAPGRRLARHLGCRLESAPYLYGSAASRRPSPKNWKASTTMMTGATGSISQG